MKGTLSFLLRVFTNKNKDLFSIRLGVHLLLSRFLITGLPAAVIGPFLCGLLGLLTEDGTFLIDVGLDVYKEAKKIPEFKAEATRLYEKVTKGVFDENKKDKIRAEYLDLIRRIGVIE